MQLLLSIYTNYLSQSFYFKEIKNDKKPKMSLSANGKLKKKHYEKHGEKLNFLLWKNPWKINSYFHLYQGRHFKEGGETI